MHVSNQTKPPSTGVPSKKCLLPTTSARVAATLAGSRSSIATDADLDPSSAELVSQFLSPSGLR